MIDIFNNPNIFFNWKMLQWLFGKKEQKKEKPQQKKEDQLGKDQKWIYDYIKQYLTSPIWRNPLLDFIEENCVIFEDSEENKFEYTKIFQEFTGLTALLLESMIEEVGISQRTLEKCIIAGMKSEKDSKIFKQILLCDNFLAFKKIMVSKNKELEVEALQKIQKESKVQNNIAQQKQIQIDIKQLERIQIQKAIAMSMAVEQKALTQQEKQLEQAIRLSQLQYQKEEEKRVETVKKEQPKQEKKKISLIGPLPPLISAKPPRPIQQYKQEESKLKQEIEVLRKKEEQRKAKDKVQQENSEQRKKRLLEQRELIRKQKQEERKQQLSNFVQHKPTTEAKLSEQELERRRNLMKRLKQQLKE